MYAILTLTLIKILQKDTPTFITINSLLYFYFTFTKKLVLQNPLRFKLEHVSFKYF